VCLLGGTEWIYRVLLPGRQKAKRGNLTKCNASFLKSGRIELPADIHCLILWTHLKQTDLLPRAARADGVISVHKPVTVILPWAYRELSVSVPLLWGDPFWSYKARHVSAVLVSLDNCSFRLTSKAMTLTMRVGSHRRATLVVET